MGACFAVIDLVPGMTTLVIPFLLGTLLLTAGISARDAAAA
jgi:hypothetical protein